MAKSNNPMPDQRDANQPAGIQSGTSVKQKITDAGGTPSTRESARPMRQRDVSVRGGHKLRS